MKHLQSTLCQLYLFKKEKEGKSGRKGAWPTSLLSRLVEANIQCETSAYQHLTTDNQATG